MTTIRDQAATALDITHYAASRKYGIYTDSARATVALWLDGGRVRTSYVRKLIKYLRMIELHA